MLWTTCLCLCNSRRCRVSRCLKDGTKCRWRSWWEWLWRKSASTPTTLFLSYSVCKLTCFHLFQERFNIFWLIIMIFQPLYCSDLLFHQHWILWCCPQYIIWPSNQQSHASWSHYFLIICLLFLKSTFVVFLAFHLWFPMFLVSVAACRHRSLTT